jgi:transcriptional regulator with GAF, ATPase, and Fis domain
MADTKSLVLTQLREACKCAGAHWAIWARRRNGNFQFLPQAALNKTRQIALNVFINQQQNFSWLAGALSSGHMRSRAAGAQAQRLGCGQIFAFPNNHDQSVLLVGADLLGKQQRDFFKILAMGGIVENDLPVSQIDQQFIFHPFDTELETTYDPEKVLQHILNNIISAVSADAAFLAIRSGDVFRILVVSGCSNDVIGMDISIQTDESLFQLVDSFKGAILPVNCNLPHMAAICAHEQQPFLEVMKVPIILGKRVLGEAVLLSKQEKCFKSGDLDRITIQMSRMAHAIENAMVFAEAVRYLQQFALLNDLALAASGGLGTDEVARRVVQRLRRSFDTEDVAVLLLTADGSNMLEYGAERAGNVRLVVPVADSLAGYVVENLVAMRLGDLREAPRYFKHGGSTQSALFVPLKYRGMPIGALGLESEKPNAFTMQDEQLMLVVASHLAGLFENARLHQEARERAGKLALIHEVIQRVLGLRDEAAIAQETADLIASYFNY